MNEAWIAIRGRRGGGIGGGRAIGTDQAVVNVSIGVDVTAEQLANDWVLIHEMIHVAFPTVPRNQHWIEEARRRKPGRFLIPM